MELDLAGGPPKVLVEDLPLPNAMEVGPDGLLYYPVMGTNDIWRIDPDGGTPERVVGDLGVPDSVKFDSAGFIVSTQVGTGEVLRIDPRTGDRTVLAALSPGLDNCTFIGDRLFVSSFTGAITEILPDQETRETLPGGLNWPLDLTVGADGSLYVADGTFFYRLDPAEGLQIVGMMFHPNYPGFVRGVEAVGAGEFLTTNSLGQLSRWRPAAMENEVLAEGFDQLYGVATAPDGALVAADLGSGRVVSVRGDRTETLAEGLDRPLGVAFTAGGRLLVSESGGGRVVEITGAGAETLVDGLGDPQGLLVRDGTLYVVDAGSKTLVSYDLETKEQATVARDLPVGAPPGVTPKPLRGAAPFSGPQGPFAGIAAGPDGTLYLAADADGSVLALRKTS
jgi:sugar lactone lactonase YvrE